MNAMTIPHPDGLSHEPGFVLVDIFKPAYTHRIPLRSPGLLAYLHIEGAKEQVLRLFVFDDLDKGFAQSRPFCGPANFIAYREFPWSMDHTYDQNKNILAERLRVYAQLTEKYDIRQVVWPQDHYTTIRSVQIVGYESR